MLEYKATDLPGKVAYEKPFNVQIRCITPVEQKYILSLSQKEQKSSKEYTEFLKKLIQIDNPEVTFEDLYWFDVQYLLYKIRYLTYAKYPIKLVFKCMECGEEINKELEIGELQIDEPNIENNIIELDNLGKVKIRNKIVRDDIDIETFIKRNKIDPEDVQTRLLLIDLCLIKDNHSLEDVYRMAENGEITASDIIAIEKWIEDNIWGVKEELLVKCPACGKEVSRGYMLSIEDFFSVI
jgi:DNA-directed RNA polymerase subunit RPC12/RpoP